MAQAFVYRETFAAFCGGHSARDGGHSARDGAYYKLLFTLIVAPLPKGSWHATA